LVHFFLILDDSGMMICQIFLKNDEFIALNSNSLSYKTKLSIEIDIDHNQLYSDLKRLLSIDQLFESKLFKINVCESK
jgi:hypothetical protein